MDSLISPPADALSEVENSEIAVSAPESTKDCESRTGLVNGECEESNGKIDSTGDDDILQNAKNDEKGKTDLPIVDHEENSNNEKNTAESSVTEDNTDKEIAEDRVEATDDIDKHNGNKETAMETEECITEPDLPIFDNEDCDDVNHVEEKDDPMDSCAINLENGDAPNAEDASKTEGETILTQFLPKIKSQLKDILQKPSKSRKSGGKKRHSPIHNISDDSDTESVSSIEELDVDALKETIQNLLDKQSPKVLNTEELKFKQSTYGAGTKIQFTRLHCTACNKHMGSALNKQKDRHVHPLLKVLVCKSCYNFYTSGDFEKDEDGSELYCRWCGQGGKVICCSECAYVFCTKCINRNFGHKRLQQIKSCDKWLCFACNSSDLLKPQVQCTALIDYLKSEMKRLSALPLDNCDLYTKDYSNCCSNRKRKASWSKDTDFNIEEELSLVKKPKTTKSRTSAVKPILNTQEQEEVVCAPDLLSFMGEDDHIDSINLDEVSIEKPNRSFSRSSPPPLLPKPTLLPNIPPALNSFRFVSPVILPKNAVLVQNPVRNTVVMQTPTTDPKPKPALVHNPASMIRAKGKQIILNTTLKNPITPQNIGNITSSIEKVSTHKITLKTPNHNLPKLVPGLKYEWFDVAAKSSADVQTKLTASILELSTDKSKATTMEDLAGIHNKFQEMLSKSINTMIQIRRALRNDFLASLNQLKFIKNVQDPKEDDDDVVFVNSTSPPKSAPPPQPPSECITIDDKPASGPYLKVRSVSQLLNVPSECITIADDVIEKIREHKKDEDTKKVQELEKSNETVSNSCDISNDSNKENVESFNNSTIVIDDDVKDGSAEEVNVDGKQKDDAQQKNELETVELTPEIQKAMFESKIEKLVNDNLKYNVSGIGEKELKRMLSARVYVSKV